MNEFGLTFFSVVAEFWCKHQYTGSTDTVQHLFGACFVSYFFWEVLLDQFTCDESQNTTINFACVNLQCPPGHSIHADSQSLARLQKRVSNARCPGTLYLQML